MVDLQSIDEVASRWSARVYKQRDKQVQQAPNRRAEGACLLGIKRLQYYKGSLFHVKERGGGGGHTRMDPWTKAQTKKKRR